VAQSDIWIATKRQKLGREYQCTIVVRVTFELPGIIMQSCDLLVTGQPDLPRQLLSVHHSSEPKNECISLLQNTLSSLSQFEPGRLAGLAPL
jgi:hypothetical protein